jgi:hypothetical protein
MCSSECAIRPTYQAYSSIPNLNRAISSKRALSRAVFAIVSIFVLGSTASAQSSLTPVSLSFGSVPVGETSKTINATFKNTQKTPLTISSIVISGNASADYASGGSCPISPKTLAAESSCTIPVTFRPPALGNLIATLTVTSSSSLSPQSIALAGIGIAPVTVAPTSLTFANTLVGATSAAKTVTLTNHLNISLEMISVAASAGFVVASNSCGASVGAGGKCTIGVTFAPTALGLLGGTLTINYDAFGSPTPVALSGTGDDTGLKSIIVTPANPSIAEGYTQQFIATGQFKSSTENLTSIVAWSSTQSNVATIATGGLATAVAVGSSNIVATLSSIKGSTTLTVTAPALVSIAVTPASPSIAKGGTQQFIATGTYSNATTQNLTSSVTWTSSNTAVATVTAGGLASGVSTGTSNIRATLGSVVSPADTLTVTPPTLVLIALTPANPTITKGGTQQFTATGTYSDTSTQNITNSVTWASSNTSVATIAAGGLATGVGTGTSNITAALGSIVSPADQLTVTPATLVSIAVTPANPSIAAGTIQQFTATGTYSDTSTRNLTTSVTWASSNSAVATIAAGGLATGAGTGTSNITATLGSVVSPVDMLTVTTATLVSIAVGPAGSSIAKGLTQQFAAMGTYSDTSTQNITTSVTWASSSPAVATIAAGGLATGVGTGTTNVTATMGSIVSPADTLTVTAATLVSIAVTPSNPSIAAGTTQQFTATGTYTDGSVHNVTCTTTWSSSAPGVATVSNVSGSQGLATAAVLGSTTIEASLGAINNSTTLTVTPGFVFTGSLNTAREYHTATVLNNGVVTIAGGENSDGVLISTELYNPATGTFTPTGSLNTAREYHTATVLNNGQVLNAGGKNSNGVLDSAELYNPSTATFTLSGSLNTARSQHTATVLNNGMVLIAGGVDSFGELVGSAELYNPATGTFTPTGSLNVARYLHTATLLNNGMVLIAGGNGSPLTSAELYDPTTATFTLTGSLNTARSQQTATLLNNGMVLIAGGYGSAGVLASAELYDPVGQSFTLTGSLNTARAWQTATLLNNGTVLIAGSYGSGGVFASAELYDPVAQTFTLAGSLNTARAWQTATLLNDGMVLIAGGDSDSGVLASAELYEPATLAPPNLVSIVLSPSNPTISLNTAQQFIATGTFSDSSTQQFASVTWSSSSPPVVSITDDASDPGVAYALAAGSATVTACAGSVCGSTTLNVGPALVSIAITPANGTFPPNSPVQFDAMGTYADGSQQDLTSLATWTSSAPAVATISNSQGVQGHAIPTSFGTTTITATYALVAGSTTLTISSSATLESITVSPAGVSLGLNGTQQFKATGNYSDGTTADLTQTANWASFNPEVVTVNDTGLATVVATPNVAVAVTASLGSIAPYGASNIGWVSALSSLPITCPAPTIDMKLLVINNAEANGGAGYADFPAIQQILNYIGTPYDVVDVSGTLPALSDGACHAYYQGVIYAFGDDIYTNPAFYQALTPYEQLFKIRQLNWFINPTPDFGFNDYMGTISDTATDAGGLTAAAAPVFFYANTSTPVNIADAYIYLTTPTTPTGGGTVTQLLVDGSGYTLSGITNFSDGRQYLSQMFDSNQYLTHDLVLAYGLINWVTQGIFLGDYHVYASPQVDDFFIDDTEWVPGASCVDPITQDRTKPDASNLPVVRVNTADMTQLAAWQNGIQTDPSGLFSNFKLTLAFNGVGTAGNGDWTGLVAPITATSSSNDLVTFTTSDFSGLPGAQITVTGTTNAGGMFNGTWTIQSVFSITTTTPATTQFTATVSGAGTVAQQAETGATASVADDLTANLESYQGAFHWISHTFDHPGTLNGLTQSSPNGNGDDIDLEVLTNLWVASNPNGVNLDTDSSDTLVPLTFNDFNPANMVTPGITGLNDLNVPTYLSADGIQYVVTDTSVTGQPNNGPNPSPNVGIVNSYEPTIYEVPRHPNDIYYNAANWNDDQAEFDCIYSYPTVIPPYNTYSAAQILNFVSASFLSNMLIGDMDPEMFHQPDLHFSVNTAPGMPSTGQTSSLIADTYNQTFSLYKQVFNLPVLSPSLDQLGQAMQNRNAFNLSNVTASIIGAYGPNATISVTVPSSSSIPAAIIPVTGLNSAGAEVYGGQYISYVTVNQGQTITLPLP